MAHSSINKLYYYDKHSLLLITRCGSLTQVHVPFKVICKVPVHSLVKNIQVYVQEVAEDKKHKILYLILDHWIPYHHFQLQVSY